MIADGRQGQSLQVPHLQDPDPRLFQGQAVDGCPSIEQEALMATFNLNSVFELIEKDAVSEAAPLVEKFLGDLEKGLADLGFKHVRSTLTGDSGQRTVTPSQASKTTSAAPSDTSSAPPSEPPSGLPVDRPLSTLDKL
jgi:hypothetical protein